MLTPTERIAKLEEEVRALRAMFEVAGALTVAGVQAVVDQMVDDGALTAATRTEIWGRLRKDLPTFRIGSEQLYQGARGAIPFYRTVTESAELKHRDARVRKELLRPQPPKPERDR